MPAAPSALVHLFAVFAPDCLRDLTLPAPDAMVVCFRFVRADDTFADCCHLLREAGIPYKLACVDGTAIRGEDLGLSTAHQAVAEANLARAIAVTHGIPKVTLFQEAVSHL